MQPTGVSLEYRYGNSDKVYHIDLTMNPQTQLWLVSVAYGRRGSTLQRQEKTKGGTSYQKAWDIYNKIYNEKLAKGYNKMNIGTGSNPATPTGHTNPQNNNTAMPAPTAPHKTRATTGHIAMLPTPVRGMAHVEELLTNDDWIAQQKFDGENRQLILDSNALYAGNRNGQTVTINPAWSPSDMPSGQHVIFGEDLGDSFVAFDASHLFGRDIQKLPYIERAAMLTEKFPATEWFSVAPVFVGTRMKRMLLSRITAQDDEGVVFKRAKSAFTPGRTTDAFKYKLKESATFIVTERKGGGEKRSVGLMLRDHNGTETHYGNVTIPANHKMPAPGSFCEIEFMYQYENGSLEQPVYKGQRTDILMAPGPEQITRIKRKAIAA